MKLEMGVFIMPHGWVGNVTVVAGRAGLALCVGIKMYIFVYKALRLLLEKLLYLSGLNLMEGELTIEQ